MLERCKTCGALTDKRLRPECRLCALDDWAARDPDRWAIHAHVWTRYMGTRDDANSTENTAATSMWLPRGCSLDRVWLLGVEEHPHWGMAYDIRPGWEDEPGLGLYEADALCCEMSDWSEDTYCAGWDGGIERELFRYAFLGESPRTDGWMIPFSEDFRERLRDLATRSGCWIGWEDGRGNVLVPLAEAMVRHA